MTQNRRALALASPPALSLAAELEQSGALTPVALTLPPDITFDTFEAVGRMLGKIDSATKWWVGDWLLTGEILFGEESYQAIEALTPNISEDTRMRYVNVAQRVPPERRRADLSWSHHKVVASLPPSEQTEYLGRAAEERWSARDLTEELRNRNGMEQRSVNQAAVVLAARVLVTASVPRDTGYFTPSEVFEALVDALGVGVSRETE